MIDYNLGEKYFNKFVSLSDSINDEDLFFDEFSHFGKDDVWEGPASINDIYNNLYEAINWAKETEKDNSSDVPSEDTQIEIPEAKDINTSQNEPVYKVHTYNFNSKYYDEKDLLEFNTAFDEVILEDPSASKYRYLLTEIAYVESGFNPRATHSSGAIGYFLFMPGTKKDTLKRLGVSASNDVFMDDHKLLIKAGIDLAKWFENQLTKYTSIALKKGHTIQGLIFGAWLGGTGGVLKYLYNSVDKKDSNGTKVSSYINKGDTVPFEYPTVNNKKGNFDVKSAIATLHHNTQFDMKGKSENEADWPKKDPNSSGHMCGKAIRLALKAGNLDPGYPGNGGQFGKYFIKSGWVLLPNDTTNFLAGDMCVITGLGTNGQGHVSMYDGSLWVSDFYLNSWNVYGNKAKRGQNTKFYRYEG